MEPDPMRASAERVPLASHRLLIRRLFDLPRTIVWDALADPVLVSGWLGTLDCDLRVGGRYRVRMDAPADRQPQDLSQCTIARLAERRILELVTSTHEPGTSGVVFTLDDVPGGPRDRSTVLTLSISSSDPFADANRMRAAWMLHLDSLNDLLHGHPVDWTCWTDVQDEAWLDLLGGMREPER